MLFLLLGCASNPEPSSQFSLVFRSEKDLNPDIHGRPSPLDVRIYQLENTKNFMPANFFDLYNTAQSALGESLLEEHRLEIKPQQETKTDFTLHPKAKHLGFLFAYHDLKEAKWKEVINAPPPSDLTIDLKARDFCLKPPQSEGPSEETSMK